MILLPPVQLSHFGFAFDASLPFSLSLRLAFEDFTASAIAYNLFTMVIGFIRLDVSCESRRR